MELTALHYNELRAIIEEYKGELEEMGTDLSQYNLEDDEEVLGLTYNIYQDYYEYHELGRRDIEACSPELSYRLNCIFQL